jgi:hypothetical protein
MIVVRFEEVTGHTVEGHQNFVVGHTVLSGIFPYLVDHY